MELPTPAELNSTSCVDLLDTFENEIKRFFKKLRRDGATQKLCDSANNGLRSLLAANAELTKSKVTNSSAKQCIESVQQTADNLVKTCSSTKKRNKILSESKFYVEPKPLSCGTESLKRKRGDSSIMVNQECTFQLIPFSETLKVLFQSPAFRRAFHEQDHVCREGVYHAACCGSVAKTGSFSKLQAEVVVQVQLFYDGLSPACGLKCNASKYSTGVVYAKVLNLPAKYQSHQPNIHLVALFLERWFKRDDGRSIDAVFKPILDDIKLLEKGINVTYEEEGKEVSFLMRGSIIYCTHDNLGCHKQFGMSGSFNTAFPCALCFIEKSQIQDCFRERAEIRREGDFYAPLGDFKYSYDLTESKGIFERTSFGDLSFYSITEAMSVDPFHDGSEGMYRNVLHEMFQIFIKQRLITKAEIVARGQSFDFGGLDYQYVARTLNIDKPNLGLSAVQTRSFFPNAIRRLGPLTLMSTAACESRHHMFTAQAQSIKNMSQLLQNFVQKNMEMFVDYWENVDDLSSFRAPVQNEIVSDKEALGLHVDDNAYEMSFYTDQYDFRPGFFVATKEQELKFLKIKKVLNVNGHTTLYCSKIKIEYDEDCVSHRIVEDVEDSTQLIKVKDLKSSVSYSSTYSRKNSQQYILAKSFDYNL